MEFYNFYNLVSGITSLFSGDNYQQMVLIGVIGGVLLWIGLFLLQGAGLYVLAKRQNMGKRWLAFIPFVNIYYMGKIIGECHFFGQRMKNAGLYAMIAQILSTLVTVAYIAAEFYLFWNFKPHFTEDGAYYWVGLKGFAETVNNFYGVGMYIMALISLVTQILLAILMMGFFKKYAPANYRILSVVIFMIPFFRFIMVFAFRNREPFDYEEYMRRQHEAYIRRQQQYYNTYGNPYGRQNNSPYGMGGYQGMQGGQQPQQPPQPTEEPFDEFGAQPSGDTQNDGGDGFFD